MNKILPLIAAASLVSSVHAAEDEHNHFDVFPVVRDGQIVTEGVTHAGLFSGGAIRAFGFEFGEDAADPYFINDPGFNSSDTDTGLPASSALRLDVRSPLLFWDGAGATPSFAPVTTGEQLRFERGSATRTVGGATGDLDDLLIQNVLADGSVHWHLNTYLLGPDGNATAGDGVEPAVGFYAVKLVVDTSATTIADSAPFYAVFNNGGDEAQHESAVDALAATLVPEPASLAAIAGAGVLALRRRR